jgi:chemotaxis regulatin CheY-phosphate phosphatase CheZ
MSKKKPKNEAPEPPIPIVMAPDFPKVTGQPVRRAEIIREIRAAVADYMKSEGCDCCSNTEEHKKAKKRLAKLLNVPKYEDGSGYDFGKFEGIK